MTVEVNSSRLRLAVLPDFPEEGWPSMDLCAESLLQESAHFGDRWQVERCLPEFHRRFGWLGRRGFNLDRAWNRYSRYPRFARGLVPSYDFFHIVDHSYAHLVHALPAERTGVYCHDLDAFRSLLEPAKEPRGPIFRKLMQRVLTGLQSASLVFANSRQTVEQLKHFHLVDERRIIYTPLGLADEFQPSDTPPDPWTLVHVGSCIPRKRVDVLLKVIAELRKEFPQLKLVKVGGEWSSEQRTLLEQHQLHPVIDHRQNLTRGELAQVYQRARVVLVTSESEGFGLPVIEALACGCPVIASDIAPLWEGGGNAASYAPVGDIPAWVALVGQLLRAPDSEPLRATRVQQARQFSWRQHAETVFAAYDALKESAKP